MIRWSYESESGIMSRGSILSSRTTGNLRARPTSKMATSGQLIMGVE